MRDLQLQILDAQWKGHLRTMDGLRESINLRGYAQRDPKIEYQREGFALFAEMEQRIDETFAGFVFRFGYPRPALVQPAAPAPRREESAAAEGQAKGAAAGAAAAARGGPAADRENAAAGAAAPGAAAFRSAAAGGAAVPTSVAKVGPNQPCPCGSGKKYKRCCGG